MKVMFCDLCKVVLSKPVRGRTRKVKTISLWGFGVGCSKDVDVCGDCAKALKLRRSKLIRILNRERGKK